MILLALTVAIAAVVEMVAHMATDRPWRGAQGSRACAQRFSAVFAVVTTAELAVLEMTVAVVAVVAAVAMVVVVAAHVVLEALCPMSRRCRNG